MELLLLFSLFFVYLFLTDVGGGEGGIHTYAKGTQENDVGWICTQAHTHKQNKKMGDTTVFKLGHWHGVLQMI